MPPLRRLFRLRLWALVLSLAACGPLYRTEYRFQPPPSDAVRLCIVQCQGFRSQCQQLQQMRYEDCQERAERDYYWCESRKRYEYRDGKRVCVRNCSCTRQYCGRSDDACDVQYRDCYQTCGGVVVEEKVCWLNCP